MEDGLAAEMTPDSSATPEERRGGVRTVERALALLSCFNVSHPAWKLADLSREVGLHKVTTRRLAKSLESRRFLQLDESSGTYRLGPALLPLTYLARSNDELVRIARPHLERLAALTQETVGLSVWTDGGVLQIDHVLTTHLFKPEMFLGSLSSTFGTTHSKIFLAFGPEERLSRLSLTTVDQPLTVAGAAAIKEELERVREDGYALDIEERLPGVCAVGAPVRDSAGEVIASIAVVVPKDRFTADAHERIVDLTRRTASVLSFDLGCESMSDALGSG
jgi:DNA-binding IclR family transcriptional regulator